MLRAQAYPGVEGFERAGLPLPARDALDPDRDDADDELLVDGSAPDGSDDRVPELVNDENEEDTELFNRNLGSTTLCCSLFTNTVVSVCSLRFNAF